MANIITAVILTCDRTKRCRESVLHNAQALQSFNADILVVNNGQQSPDLPDDASGVPVRLIKMPNNLGAQARNTALLHTNAKILLFLDDDAYIEPAHINAMLQLFQENNTVGAVSFRIYNGEEQEASLLPTAFHGCAVAIRRDVLQKTGGYPKGYMYYAEEYHLAFRIMQCGFQIAFADVDPPVQHIRDSAGRSKAHIISRLIRNNTRLFTAFLPWHAWLPSMADMLQRYKLVAVKENALSGYQKGQRHLVSAIFRGLIERHPLNPPLFRQVALLTQLDQALALCQQPHPVVLCGTGRFPRLWLSHLQKCGFPVCAFLDSNPCWTNRHIQGIPVLQSMDMLPGGTPLLALNGHSSFAETDYWENRLAQHGFTPAKEENPAQTAEKHSAFYSHDLLAYALRAPFMRNQ